MNHYERLGVTKDASTDEIHDAYRKAIAQTHPDINSAAEASSRTKELMQAYQTLSDAELRAAYDEPKLPPYRKKIDEPYYHLTEPIRQRRHHRRDYSLEGGNDISVSVVVIAAIFLAAVFYYAIVIASGL